MLQKILVLSGALFFSAAVYAQGCSDGGFCSLKYHAAGNTPHNSITIGNNSGVGDGNTVISNTYVAYTRKFGGQLFWDTKITVNYAAGTIANNFNAGDVFTNFSYTIHASPSHHQSLVLLGGLKIPLTSGNDKAGNKPLPMTFQSSLGTYDLLIGANYVFHNWEFTQAWQVPFTKENKNTFLKEYAVSNDFPSSNKFQRKADALARVAYTIRIPKSRFAIKPNLLAIYHLSEDSYENIYGRREVLAGSKGLTLNANLIGSYQVANRQTFYISLAAPFVVRDIRPDGLTRKFTVGVDYKIDF